MQVMKDISRNDIIRLVALGVVVLLEGLAVLSLIFKDQFFSLGSARPSPEGARVITALDTHAAGEPLRIVTGGYPELPGATILERRRYAKEHHDDLRRALMWEPRGHADMYGCILTPPVSPDANFG